MVVETCSLYSFFENFVVSTDISNQSIFPKKVAGVIACGFLQIKVILIH
jgi:hypothetical protein